MSEIYPERLAVAEEQVAKDVHTIDGYRDEVTRITRQRDEARAALANTETERDIERADAKRLRAELDAARQHAEECELQRDEARDKLGRALAANERWAVKLGEVQQKHADLRAEARQLRTERDQALGVNENLRGQLAATTADLADIYERLETLAVRLEASADFTAPSKKSEIERQCAKAIREIAERPF
jgi:chromosome segregation ATPase